MASFPYNVRYVGDCRASGHGNVMRGNLAVLQELGISAEKIDILPWPIAEDPPHDWFYRRYLCARERPLFQGTQHLNIINVHLPDAGRFWTAGWYNVCIAPWETDRLPTGTFVGADAQQATVTESLNRMEEIWAPCERVKATLEAGGVTSPIFVIPHALQPELIDAPLQEVEPDWAPKVHPYVGPHEHKHTTPVCFYYVGAWNERKNVQALLRAYYATGWTPVDPVELVIHSTAAADDAEEAHAFITQTQQQAVRDCLPNPLDAPITRVLTQRKSYAWICKLHAANHIFVTATRGEGFCLPAWEAAAMGNLVIHPKDAVPGDIPMAMRVGTELRDIAPMADVQGYELGQQWWDCKVSDLTTCMQDAFAAIRSGKLRTNLTAAAHDVRAALAPGGKVGTAIVKRLQSIEKVLDGSGW